MPLKRHQKTKTMSLS